MHLAKVSKFEAPTLSTRSLELDLPGVGISCGSTNVCSGLKEGRVGRLAMVVPLASLG